MLGDEEFGIIANSKNEDAIIFAVGDAVTENEEGADEEKKHKIKKLK